MKRILFILQIGLFITMNFFLLMAVYEVFQPAGVLGRPGYNDPRYDMVEEYDPSLQRLDNVVKLTAYCDSVFADKTYTNKALRYESDYPETANEVVRK